VPQDGAQQVQEEEVEVQAQEATQVQVEEVDAEVHVQEVAQVEVVQVEEPDPPPPKCEACCPQTHSEEGHCMCCVAYICLSCNFICVCMCIWNFMSLVCWTLYVS
jgi:hypothetical protein